MSRLTGADALGLYVAYQAVYNPQELTEEQVWEEVETWVNSLIEEGYDLSDYTWEEMYEAYLEEAPMTAFQAAGGNAKLAQLNKGLSPRSGLRATAQSIEKQGQDNLFRAGGGNAAIAKGPTRSQNVRGGGQVQVPTRTRQDVINRGTVAAAKPAVKPATTPAAAKPATTPAAAKPAAAPAAATPAKPAAATPSAKPAMGPTGKPLVGGIERRTPTRAEMDAAKAYRTPAATTGALGAATAAAASKPAAFGSSTPASKPAAAPTPTPAAAPAAKPTPVATGSKKPGSIVSHFDPFDVIKGHLLDEGYADTEESALAIMTNMSEEWRQSILGEGDKYDKNRQRAAKRAAERNAARDRGQTGNVPGVGYVTPRRERETYRDSAGTERHTSGAKMPKKEG
jgi:hypothetical protein